MYVLGVDYHILHRVKATKYSYRYSHIENTHMEGLFFKMDNASDQSFSLRKYQQLG